MLFHAAWRSGTEADLLAARIVRGQALSKPGEANEVASVNRDIKPVLPGELSVPHCVNVRIGRGNHRCCFWQCLRQSRPQALRQMSRRWPCRAIVCGKRGKKQESGYGCVTRHGTSIRNPEPCTNAQDSEPAAGHYERQRKYMYSE